MHLCCQPADARAERRPAEDVRREVLPGGNAQGGHAEGPDIARRCAAVAPSSDAIPANPTVPTRSAVLMVPADPEKVWRAERSIPGSDCGSHGAQDGATFGSFVASGMSAATPAAATDTASPQRRLYGACPAADGPETTRKTIAAVSRRMSDSTRNGRPTSYALEATRARCRISHGLAVLAPRRYAWG